MRGTLPFASRSIESVAHRLNQLVFSGHFILEQKEGNLIGNVPSSRLVGDGLTGIVNRTTIGKRE